MCVCFWFSQWIFCVKNMSTLFMWYTNPVDFYLNLDVLKPVWNLFFCLMYFSYSPSDVLFSDIFWKRIQHFILLKIINMKLDFNVSFQKKTILLFYPSYWFVWYKGLDDLSIKTGMSVPIIEPMRTHNWLFSFSTCRWFIIGILCINKRIKIR